MSLAGGRRYTYRGFSNDDDRPYSTFNDAFTGPPPGAINVRSYTLADRRPKREPIMIVPQKRKPRYITMEVKEPEQPPIMIVPPEPPKKKVIEYEVPVPPKPQEPILVPVMPPPQPPEYMTVRHVVEEGENAPGPVAVPQYPAVAYNQPAITRLPSFERRRHHQTKSWIDQSVEYWPTRARRTGRPRY